MQSVPKANCGPHSRRLETIYTSAVGTLVALRKKPPSNPALLWRRGEGVEPSGNNISRQAGFEDRWGHRAPSSSIPYSLRGCGDLHNPRAGLNPKEANGNGNRERCKERVRSVGAHRNFPLKHLLRRLLI